MIQTDSGTIDEYNKSNNLEMLQGGYITKILEQKLSEYSSEYIVFDYEDGVWTIILEDVHNLKRDEIAREIILKLLEETAIHVKVCFSSYGSEIKELPARYEEVRNLCKYSFYIGEEDILGYGYNCDKNELDEVKEIGALKDIGMPIYETIPDLLGNRAVKSYTKPVEEGILLIEEKYNENLSLEEICTKIAISKNYFCYLFKRETGMSIWNYLTVVRLQHAKQLLESTDMRSYEIAFLVGYDNPSYFSKLFKKYELMTPNEYRENRK
jgi:two-component system response regulator YesN